MRGRKVKAHAGPKKKGGKKKNDLSLNLIEGVKVR